MKYSTLILFCLVLLGSSSTTSETLLFDVVMKEEIVGELTATKSKAGELTFYKSHTKIKTNFLKEINVNYQFDVTFKKEFLIQSLASIQVNKKMFEKTTTQKKDKKYQIISQKHKEKWVSDPILYSSVKLYFDEPTNVKESYAEQDGSFHSIKSLGNHTYQKTNPKGKTNKYFYKNGQLETAHINAGVVKFKIVRKK